MKVGREPGLEPVENNPGKDFKGGLQEGDGSAVVDRGGAFFGDR
jgi:hypothetical protein